jgi:hypothetical protein
MVDSAPGEATADLCTSGTTAAAIDAFMRTNLPATGWRFDAQAGDWCNGPILTFRYAVTALLPWTILCRCGGM